jgi:hypothetical protein
MGWQLLTPNSEAAIWARLMQAHKNQLSAEAAEYLLAVDFDKSDQQRMLQLAERSEAGTLTDEERTEAGGRDEIALTRILWIAGPVRRPRAALLLVGSFGGRQKPPRKAAAGLIARPTKTVWTDAWKFLFPLCSRRW